MTQSAIEPWFKAHNEVTQILVGVFDYNGVLRGKRMPIAKLPSLLKEGFLMPLSIIQTDIWGRDIDDSPLLFETGDGDGRVMLSDRTPLMLSWLAEPTALLIGHFVNRDGTSHPVCPRGALMRAVTQLDKTHSRLCTGIEMEFHLLSDDISAPAPSLATGTTPVAGDTLSTHQLDDYDGLFAEISHLCQAQDIAIDTLTSELGRGQFEITFAPKHDLVTVAEDILVFKYLVKSLAKSFGVRASFMAKPLTGDAGNGMHVHASLLNEAGQNLFHDEQDKEHRLLHQCLAGILANMRASTLILAPHMNSYRRLVPSSHAPTKICWGDDNRTASIRIPASSAQARRLEYRSAGADGNPYLLLAVLASSIAHGIAEEMSPPPPVKGNAYEQDFDDLPSEMGEAMRLFAASEEMKQALGETLHAYYLATKRQEWARMADYVSDFEYHSLSQNI